MKAFDWSTEWPRVSNKAIEPSNKPLRANIMMHASRHLDKASAFFDTMRRFLEVVSSLLSASLIQGFVATGFVPPSPSRLLASRSKLGSSCTACGLGGRDLRMAAAAIVGGGRIGSALYDMGGGADTLVGRGDDIPAGDGPIYVCTRNDDLENVISRTPASRRQDLVFLQNGVLGPLLEKHGLAANTQVLIYFAVAKKGEVPIDGVTDANPEGLTSACGKWAEEFKERIAKGGLTCHTLPEDKYTARMYEKHMWICAFMLCGAAHKCNMGEVDANNSDEVRALIGEMQAAIENEHGVTFEGGVQDRLCAYARSVAHYPAAVKEFSWRNGFFWEVSENARKEGKKDPCPLHSKLLRQVADEQGLSL